MIKLGIDTCILEVLINAGIYSTRVQVTIFSFNHKGAQRVRMIKGYSGL